MSQRAYSGVPSFVITQPMLPDGVWKSFVPKTTIGVGAGVGVAGGEVTGGNVPSTVFGEAHAAKQHRSRTNHRFTSVVLPAVRSAPRRARSTAVGGRAVR